jgi:hypothetical protein
MNLEEAFANIISELEAARDKKIKPSIRISGKEWTCSLEDKHRKFVAIAKEEELVLVTMKSGKGEPAVTRVQDPAYKQESFIERIKQSISEA